MSQIEDIDVRDFKEAIEDSETFKIPEPPKNSEIPATSYPPRKRHLLLGNGFSIAYDPIFDYRSLFEAAKSFKKFSNAPHLPKVFDLLDDTKDFEKVIRFLRDTSKILRIYNNASSVADKIERDAEVLKSILISTISDIHPQKFFDFNDADFLQCRKNFLCHFLEHGDKNGNIYTLNYDLLLYWAIGYDDDYIGYDGFGRKGSNGPLIWINGKRRTFHYLHGALHLFDTGSYLQKITGKDKLTILPQVQDEISSGKYPLFVAEGESKQKRLKIESDEYLRSSYKNFTEKMNQPNDVLFIFGHRLDNKSDKHIFKCIIEGKISRVYVSLYDDPESGYDPNIRKNAEEWETLRAEHYSPGEYPLKVKFFDAESAEVWQNKNVNSK